MRRFILTFIFAITIIGLVGCSSYKNAPRVTYCYNRISDCLGTDGEFWIYDFMFPLIGTRDNMEDIPAHYQIFIPDKRELKKLYGVGYDRCFLYSKGRGIAIFQDIDESNRKFDNGFRQIPASSADEQLSRITTSYATEIKIRDGRKHYIFVDNEIRVLMFNLMDNDYHDFVEQPLNTLTIRRRGTTRMRSN